MRKKSFIIVVLLSLLTMGMSCRKDNMPEWDVDMNLPLFHTSLGIQNLLADSLLSIESDHTITLVFKNPLYAFNLDSVVSLPDTISHKFYPAVPGITINPGQEIYSQSETQSFDFSGADVLRVDLRTGLVSVDFVNSIHEEVIVHYKILSATRSGQCFEIQETIPAAGTQPYHYYKEFDISNYSLDLRGSDLMTSNKVITWSSVKLSPNASPVTLTAADEFNMVVLFQTVSISYARGYFSQQMFSWGPDVTKLDLFKSITGGVLDLESIHMTLGIENGFGIDARVKIKELTSINTKSGHEVALNSPLIGQSINIGRALETGNMANPVTPTSYSFNLDASNVLELIENLPDQLRFWVEVESNPMGNISGGNDFVYYDHYLNTSLDMEIPLSLRSENLGLADTIDFDAGDPEDTHAIIGGELSLLIDNGFPLDALISLSVLDSNGLLTDVLLQDAQVNAALLNGVGFAETARRSVIRIPLDRERIDLLYSADRFVVKALLNTATGDYIKIYDTYSMDLKLTAKFTYEVGD